MLFLSVYLLESCLISGFNKLKIAVCFEKIAVRFEKITVRFIKIAVRFKKNTVRFFNFLQKRCQSFIPNTN